MKRDIRFRAKDKDGSQWHYGWLYHTHIFDGRFSCEDRMIIRNDCDEDYTVKEDTIGQLVDVVDCMSKPIYEGDIVKRTANMRNYAECNGETIEYFEVQYQAPNWYPFRDISDDMSEYEVVGNIYDNPELINE